MSSVLDITQDDIALRLAALAATFPTLKHRVACVGSRSELLDVLRRTASGIHGSGAMHAARFCYDIAWSHGKAPAKLRFDLAGALCAWDNQHRAAFAAWAANAVFF